MALNLWNVAKDTKNLFSGNLQNRVAGAIGTVGTALKLPEMNISEKLAKPAYAAEKKGDVLSAAVTNPYANASPYNISSQPKGTTTTQKQAAPTGGQPNGGNNGGGSNDPLRDAVDNSGAEYVKSAEEIAAEQEASDKQAAMEEWQANKGALDNAKVSAKDLLDWAVNTISGSKQANKDILAAGEKADTAALTDQQKKEESYYSNAKQDVLQTYRDMSLKSEKVMRGSGMVDSSRAMEAQNQLGQLLTKDMSTWSDKEVSAYKAIADKITQVKTAYGAKSRAIDDEAQSKIDKANLDYQAEVRDIDNSYLINDNAKAAAIREATSKAKQLIANAKVEQANRKANLESQLAIMKADVDKTITSGLGAAPDSLNTLRTNESQIGNFKIGTNGAVTNGMPAGYLQLGNKAKDDDVLANTLWEIGSLSNPANVGGYKFDLGA